MNNRGIGASLTFAVPITTKLCRSLSYSTTREFTRPATPNPHLTKLHLARTSWDSLTP